MWTLVRSRRVWFGVVVVGGLLALALWPRAVAVETTTVTSGPLVVTIDEDGRTRVRERFVVTAPVSGDVLRIELEPGDTVRKGQRVALIRPAAPVPLDARIRAEREAGAEAARAAVRRLTAELARAESAGALAERELTRVKALAAGGAVAREEVDRRQTDADASGAAVRAAQAALVQAEREADAARASVAPARTTGEPVAVTSPVDGVVLVRHRQSESVVPAGDPLLEIGDPSRLEIVADVLSADAVKIHTGSRVIVERWGGGTPLAGHVRLVEPAGFTKISALGVEEQRVNVIVDFDAASAEAARRLGDGYRVEVRVVVWEAASVTTVPSGALFRRGDRWAAYVVKGGRASLRDIVLGERNAEQAEARTGVSPGDAVVLYPPDTLGDGMRVVARVR